AVAFEFSVMRCQPLRRALCLANKRNYRCLKSRLTV
ncbi:N-acetyltransferase, partial [Vibrio cholerae]|nr:N-acetyltransferase [Vibrio cholerae]